MNVSVSLRERILNDRDASKLRSATFYARAYEVTESLVRQNASRVKVKLPRAFPTIGHNRDGRGRKATPRMPIHASYLREAGLLGKRVGIGVARGMVVIYEVPKVKTESA